MFKKVNEWYSLFFSIEEIVRSKRLQSIFFVSWALCLYDLTKKQSSAVFLEQLSCWSYFEDCHKLKSFFLPLSYAYNLWCSFLLCILLAGIFFIIKKKWNYAHLTLLIVISWIIFFNFFLFNAHDSNYLFFHLFPSVILLFSKNKWSSLRFTYALMYLLTAKVKFDDAWIQGTYFSSTHNGLPIFPRMLIPVLTNLVILGEIIFSVGLIYPQQQFRKISMYSWTTFHLFSSAIVGYSYPVRCLAFLWTIFGLTESSEEFGAKVDMRLYPKAISIIAVLVLINFIPNVLSKNPNVTHEGLEYGFHMLNSNYQCRVKIREMDGSKNIINQWETNSSNPMNRCHIYDFYLKIRQQCNAIPTGHKITWTYCQSRNGSPFYELVNEVDACNLFYDTLAHNVWINYPTKSSIVGYPTKNYFEQGRSSKNLPMNSSPLESETPIFLEKNYEKISLFYKSLWVLAFLYFIFWGVTNRWSRPSP